jgi:nicotinate-nucleotide adenylyltransferase
MFPQAWDWTHHPRDMSFGLLGGTFDPIHYAHLLVAEIVRTTLPLERIIFMPSATAPHKTGKPVTPALHRWHMLQGAIATNPAFAASSLELERGGTSFTVDTLSTLHELYGCQSSQIHLIIGADNFLDLPSWKEPERLFELARIVVVNRPFQEERSKESPFAGRVRHVRIPMLDISASAIRERVQSGLSIRYWTPDVVADYIQSHQLYGHENKV